MPRVRVWGRVGRTDSAVTSRCREVTAAHSYELQTLSTGWRKRCCFLASVVVQNLVCSGGTAHPRDPAPVADRLSSLQVVIDACVVGASSAFLQQAAHLTGGVYLCPARPAGLLQYLLMVRCPCRIRPQRGRMPCSPLTRSRAVSSRPNCGSSVLA
jgi:hypothetical protein